MIGAVRHIIIKSIHARDLALFLNWIFFQVLNINPIGNNFAVFVALAYYRDKRLKKQQEVLGYVSNAVNDTRLNRWIYGDYIFILKICNWI